VHGLQLNNFYYVLRNCHLHGPISLSLAHEVSQTRYGQTPRLLDIATRHNHGCWVFGATTKTRCYRLQMRLCEDTCTRYSLQIFVVHGFIPADFLRCCLQVPPDTPGTLWRLANNIPRSAATFLQWANLWLMRLTRRFALTRVFASATGSDETTLLALCQA
jgi:hypothetical protein